MLENLTSGAYLREIGLLRDKVPSFEHYPFTIPGIAKLETLEFHPQVTFFIGENGSGKSTLLESIAIGLGLNPEGGSRNFRFSTRASHSTLHQFLRLSRSHRKPRDMYFLRAESFFNVATEIENLDKEPGLGPPVISYYGGKYLALSERLRQLKLVFAGCVGLTPRLVPRSGVSFLR